MQVEENPVISVVQVLVEHPCAWSLQKNKPAVLTIWVSDLEEIWSAFFNANEVLPRENEQRVMKTTLWKQIHRKRVKGEKDVSCLS